MDNAILEILEEIKTKQTEQAKQLSELSKPPEPQTPIEPPQPQEPQIHKHIHKLELTTSKWLIMTSTLTFFLVGSTVLNYNQHQSIKLIEMNDLKYRYIKMKGEVAATELVRLDTLSSGEMKKMKNDVLEYEQLVQEQAEITARAIYLQMKCKKFEDGNTLSKTKL